LAIKQYQLVGGLEHFLFFHILGIIIPTDFHIFQRGRSTTNQSGMATDNPSFLDDFLSYQLETFFFSICGFPVAMFDDTGGYILLISYSPSI